MLGAKDRVEEKDDSDGRQKWGQLATMRLSYWLGSPMLGADVLWKANESAQPAPTRHHVAQGVNCYCLTSSLEPTSLPHSVHDCLPAFVHPAFPPTQPTHYVLLLHFCNGF